MRVPKVPEEVIEVLGFDSEDEMARMVLAVDQLDPRILYLFQKWERHDMSKKGLQKILDRQIREQ